MFEEQVNIAAVLRSNDLLQPYDVLVLDLPQQVDLSINALSIGLILKGEEHLLYSVDHLCLPASHLPHVPICPASDLLEHLKALLDLGLEEVVEVAALGLAGVGRVAHRKGK